MIGTYPRKAKYTRATTDLLKADKSVISPSYTRDLPFVVNMGIGREVQDVDSNWYLDFGAGIAVTSTGHCHPRVVNAIKHQAEMLIHMSGTDFYYQQQVELAERLKPYCFYRMPVFYGNSGAEAVEAAMKIARYNTCKPGFIAFTGAFHGRTMGALSLTGSKAVQRTNYLPLQPVVHAPYPNCYDCIFNREEAYCRKNGAVCVDYIDNMIISKGIMPKEDCAALVLEPIQGEGGYIVPPDFWFKDINAMADMNDLLIICDEVQAGIGRTGHFWAHQNFEDFHPDIITSAKGIASGMPLGVMLAKGDLMYDWKPGSHASTFGGNPIACAAAVATIETIEREKLMDNAEVIGKHLGKMLEFLHTSYGIVENPRGLGLMRAVDVLGENKAGTYRDQVIYKSFEKGLILLGCGANGIRFCPALNVTKEEVDTCVCIIEDSIKEII